MILNILNYLIVIATLFFGYRIYISRKQGKKFTEIKPLLAIDTTNFDVQNRPLIYSKTYVDSNIIQYYLMRNNFDGEEIVPNTD